VSHYRYLIETADDSVYLTTVTKTDSDGTGCKVASVEAAKEMAARDPALNGEPVRWKDPPQAWQPYAVAISQWLDDGVEENVI
jgi:hypothetical protein